MCFACTENKTNNEITCMLLVTTLKSVSPALFYLDHRKQNHSQSIYSRKVKSKITDNSTGS